MVKDSGAVIFFYPKANTSGCTLQACQFRDNYATFESKGFKVYGMSADPPAAQLAWKNEHDFKYPLLCDTDMKVRPVLAGRAGSGDAGAAGVFTTRYPRTWRMPSPRQPNAAQLWALYKLVALGLGSCLVGMFGRQGAVVRGRGRLIVAR